MHGVITAVPVAAPFIPSPRYGFHAPSFKEGVYIFLGEPDTPPDAIIGVREFPAPE